MHYDIGLLFNLINFKFIQFFGRFFFAYFATLKYGIAGRINYNRCSLFQYQRVQNTFIFFGLNFFLNLTFFFDIFFAMFRCTKIRYSGWKQMRPLCPVLVLARIFTHRLCQRKKRKLTKNTNSAFTVYQQPRVGLTQSRSYSKQLMWIGRAHLIYGLQFRR